MGKAKAGKAAPVAGDPKMESFKQQLIDPAKLLSKNKNQKSKHEEVARGTDKEKRSVRGEEEDNEATQKVLGTEVDSAGLVASHEDREGVKPTEMTAAQELPTERAMTNAEEENHSTGRQEVALGDVFRKEQKARFAQVG